MAVTIVSHTKRISLCGMLAALAGATHAGAVRTNSAGRSPLDEAIAFGKLGLETGILGVIFIPIGLLLTFVGKRLFKLFLGLIGFVAGGVLGSVLIANLDDIFHFSNYKLALYGGAAVCALLGASICLLLWKTGIYAAAATGGFFLVSMLLSLRAGSLLTSPISRQIALTVGAVAGAVLAMLLEDMVVIAASAIIGGVILMVGLDCFLNTGFKEQLYATAISHSLSLATLNRNTYLMFAATAAFAVVGTVTQLLSARGKGYGRSG